MTIFSLVLYFLVHAATRATQAQRYTRATQVHNAIQEQRKFTVLYTRAKQVHSAIQEQCKFATLYRGTAELWLLLNYGRDTRSFIV